MSNSPKKTFAFIDLFAGIGGFRFALESFGGVCVFSSEWNKNSQETYLNNFGELPHGDITKIKEQEIPDHDVLCAGFPCQAFSISGKMKGFNDARGTLFFDVARIAKHKKPSILFLENVKNLKKHNDGKTIETILRILDEIGYKVFTNVLKSSDYEVPQARERIYIIGFRKDLNVENFEFPTKSAKTKIVKDILEDERIVPKECYISRPDIKIRKTDEIIIDSTRPLQIGTINNGGQGERIYSINAAGITLSAFGGGAAAKTGAYLVNNKIRKLTPRECARLQGFPENFILPPQRNVAYQQFGDSVSVPVLKLVFEKILCAYPDLKNTRTTNSIKKAVIRTLDFKKDGK